LEVDRKVDEKVKRRAYIRKGGKLDSNVDRKEDHPVV
jgi:hypothetical protein